MLERVVVALKAVPPTMSQGRAEGLICHLIKRLRGASYWIHCEVDILIIHHLLAPVLVNDWQTLRVPVIIRGGTFNEHERTGGPSLVEGSANCCHAANFAHAIILLFSGLSEDLFHRERLKVYHSVAGAATSEVKVSSF